MAPPRSIEDRIPSILGWLSESNSFKTLHKVLMDNLGKNEMTIGLIRGTIIYFYVRTIPWVKANFPGAECANVDGGLIVDPPDGFPFTDLTAALEWLRQHQSLPLSAPLEIYRLDAKFGSSPPHAGQWVPYYMVTVPEFPQYTCIVPMRSWRGIWRTMLRSGAEGMAQGRSRLPSDNELVFSDVLAPYAVHVSNLYEALTRIVGAARQKIAYVNPSNGVEFHGWMVPDPDKTANGVLKITSRKYHLSDQSIERLRDFMKNVPGLKLMSNPIAPLVCDLYLYDEQEDVSYNVEHKAYGEENPHIPLKPLDSDFDLKLNWHFLLVQKGESLAIHTRSGGDSADTTARLISMVEDGSCTDFASIIRENGPHAKARLREKWKEADLYDDTVDFGPIAKGENSEGGTPGSHHSAIEVALMGLAFRVHINEQCYKFRKHACILLHNHPAADAVMVEHEWTTTDQELYEASGLLPVSLVAGAAGAKRCILLKFIPHHRPEAVKSTSELFELAANTGWTFPVCTAQDFVFVAMTGGFAMPDQVPCLDNIALLPSSLTTILPQSRACVTCEDKSRVREWNWVRTTIGGCELSRSSRGKLFSFPASPYIKSEAKPLNKLYTLNDGSVHEFFHKVFNANDTELTTSIHGSSGLLQRQWNHGDMKLHDDNKAHTAFR